EIARDVVVPALLTSGKDVIWAIWLLTRHSVPQPRAKLDFVGEVVWINARQNGLTGALIDAGIGKIPSARRQQNHDQANQNDGGDAAKDELPLRQRQRLEWQRRIGEVQGFILPYISDAKRGAHLRGLLTARV